MLSTVKSNLDIDECSVLIGYNFYNLPISMLNISKESILDIIKIGNNIEIKTKCSLMSGFVDIVNHGIYQCSSFISARLINIETNCVNIFELHQDHSECGWWYYNIQNHDNPYEIIEYIKLISN